MKKSKIPHPLFLDLRIYFLALLKKWLFWLFLILDAIALIIQFLDPRFRLEQIYYIGFALIGFAWSSFEVYRELLQAHRKVLPEKFNPISSLAISFVEGNEYSVFIDEPYPYSNIQIVLNQIEREKLESHYDEYGILFVDGKPYYQLPSAYIDMNLRVENSGDLSIDIIDIEKTVDLAYSPVRVFSDAAINENGKAVIFPKHIKSGEIFLVKARVSVSVGISQNPAQFAATFRQLTTPFNATILFETLDSIGKNHSYGVKIKISWKPVIDLYINQWQQYYQKDYLRLAGYE